MYDYIHWAGYRGLQIRKAIAIENYNHINGMGYGIQAAEYIAKGETIFEVPSASFIFGKEYYHQKEGRIKDANF